jgi:hypothetical protein
LDDQHVERVTKAKKRDVGEDKRPPRDQDSRDLMAQPTRQWVEGNDDDAVLFRRIAIVHVAIRRDIQNLPASHRNRGCTV